MAEEIQDQDPQETTDDALGQESGDAPEVTYPFEAEDVASLRKKVTVTVERPRIEAKLDELYGELGDSAQIPGFRIGHAPRQLIEKRFGREVSHDVRNSLVAESMGQVLESAEFRTIGEPEVDIETIELPSTGDLVYSSEIEVVPEFELPELDGIAVKRPKLEVTPERIDEYLDRMRRSRPQYQACDEPAAEGDLILAETRLSGEGIESPIEAKDRPLRVAPGEVEGVPLVELAAALTGKGVGDTASLTVTVPQAHPNEDWRGKEVTIEITPSQVQKRVLPEIDEAFAASYGFDDLTEMREYIGDVLSERLVSEVRDSMREQIATHLVDRTSFDLPADLAARHAAGTLQRRYVSLLRQGVPREEVDEHMAELKASADKESARALKLQFIVGKIARDEGVEVGEDEVNARIASIAAQYDRRPERLRQELEQDGTIGQIETQLIEERVLDALLERAEVTEVEPEAAETDPEAPTDQISADSAETAGEAESGENSGQASGESERTEE